MAEGGGVGIEDAFPLLAVNSKNPLPLQKVMHTRKRHMELFQELNQKFQTLDRFRDIPNMGSMVSNRKNQGGGARPATREQNIQIPSVT